jgi:hypothetical protein
MLSIVKAKLALLVHTKVAAAVVGAVLVAGGGTAVAAVATHGHLDQVGSGLAAQVTGKHGTPSAGDNGKSGDHQSAEGTLTAYTAPSGATPGSITVQPSQGSAVSFQVTSDTKVNGEHTGGQQSGGQHTASTPGSGQHSEGTPSTSKQSSDEQAGSLSDLAAAIGHKVQVQANKSGSNWVAWKVTIQGAQGDQTDGQDGNNQGEQDVSGTVKSTNGSSFVLTTAQGDVTVKVDSNTHFGGDGHAAAVSALAAGTTVEVQGTKQTDGSILAKSVEVKGTAGSGSGGDGKTGGGDLRPTPSQAGSHD